MCGYGDCVFFWLLWASFIRGCGRGHCDVSGARALVFDLVDVVADGL